MTDSSGSSAAGDRPASLVGRRLAEVRPSATVVLAQMARQLVAEGRDVIDVVEGEADFPTPSPVVEAAIAALRAGETRYTAVGGTPRLKAAIAGKFRRDNGLDYRPDEIIAGTGAKQVIFNALMCSLDPGDEVIVPSPYWVSYPDMVRLCGGVPVIVEGRPQDGFKLRPAALAAALTARTRWLILNSPGNPSGAVYGPDELAPLLEIVARHPGIGILSDDIYEHTTYPPARFCTPAAVMPALKDRVLTVNGVSKAYAMTGWRIGFAGGPADLIAAMTVLQGQSTTNPSSIGQAAAVAALDGPQQVVAERRDILRRRRDLLATLLDGIPGLRCPPPEGAFYLFVDAAGLIGAVRPDGRIVADDVDLAGYFLAQAGVALIPGSSFGCAGHLRICFARPEPVLTDLAARLRAACGALARRPD